MPIIDELVVGLLRTFNLEVDITSYFSCPTTLLAVPIKNKKMNILTLILEVFFLFVYCGFQHIESYYITNKSNNYEVMSETLAQPR